MLSPLSVRSVAICLCWGVFLGIPVSIFGQTNYYRTNGTEYAVVGSLPGDQVWPDVAVTTNGGFVVWQDNATDGSGWGISATRLTPNLSPDLVWADKKVNFQGTNDQQNPRVAMLKNGGAVFVWQGGKPGYQRVFARFLGTNNTFLTTTDVLVSTFTYTNNFQINPAVTVLNNSNVVVVWGSFDEAGTNSLQDVYGQILSPTGQKVGGEFLINQFTTYNQHAPTIAALTNGGFAVAWVSEQERVVADANPVNVSPDQITYSSVDIYARLYSSNGVAQGNEFLVNTDHNPCANPSLAAASDGSLVVAWQAHDLAQTNAWDIFARPFSTAGVGGSTFIVNSHVAGIQYLPHIRGIGAEYLIVWTSVGQDGSREGVFGQFVHADGSLVGGESRVNTTTISQQMQPAVASDGVNQFLVVWTSYAGNPYSFDLFAQRYINVAALLEPMGAPFVYAPFTLTNNVYQPQLAVSWPPLLGISVSNYEVYVDGAGTPMGLTTNNGWTMTTANGLTAGSTHSFRLDYMTTDGRHSPISPSASGTTWSGLNWGGIPYEWMAVFYGGYFNGIYHTNNWPSPNAPAAPGGPALLQVFLSGGNPFDSSTWLQTLLTRTQQGMFLSWNTQPGFTYQVQVTTNFTSWSNVGAPRFAAGITDSIYVGGGTAGYYRVMLLR